MTHRQPHPCSHASQALRSGFHARTREPPTPWRPGSALSAIRMRNSLFRLLQPPARHAFASLACTVLLAIPCPAAAGGVTGGATEWTQLLNNAELASIASLEGRTLSTETESLAAQLEQLRTQIASWEIMRRNIARLPERHFAQAIGPVLRLHRIASETGAIIRSGSELDRFLRSALVTDPLFDQRGLDRAAVAESYSEWNDRWHASLETGLRQSGLTMEDVETEARLLDRITGQFGTEDGQMQVLQGANDIAASLARQMNDLRRITATQSETVAVAWGRVLSGMDREEAAERLHEREIHETLESLRNAPKGRTMNELFGIGRPRQ